MCIPLANLNLKMCVMTRTESTRGLTRSLLRSAVQSCIFSPSEFIFQHSSSHYLLFCIAMVNFRGPAVLLRDSVLRSDFGPRFCPLTQSLSSFSLIFDALLLRRPGQTPHRSGDLSFRPKRRRTTNHTTGYSMIKS